LLVSFIFIGIKNEFNLKLVKSLIINFCYLQNYFYYNFIPHTWSLAVEEHFYIFFPIILFLYLKTKKNIINFNTLLITIIIFINIVRYINAYNNSLFNEYVGFFHPTHLRLDSICFGVLISFYYNFHILEFNKFFYKKKILIFGISLLVQFIFINFLKSVFYKIFGFSILYLAFGCVLGYFICLQNNSFNFVIKIIANIGKYSYSIYLYHYLVIFFYYPNFCNPHIQILSRIFLYFTYTFLLSYIMVKYIEIPSLKLQNKLVK